MTRTASARILSLPNHFANGQVAELGGELIDIGQGSAADQAEFAGEHCLVEAQRFMEGGCETGQNAADAVLGELGLKAARLDWRGLRPCWAA
ncbi:MAG: hypothetical protein WBN85_01545 [Candidatus Macondimonas sp.]